MRKKLQESQNYTDSSDLRTHDPFNKIYFKTGKFESQICYILFQFTLQIRKTCAKLTFGNQIAKVIGPAPINSFNNNLSLFFFNPLNDKGFNYFMSVKGMVHNFIFYQLFSLSSSIIEVAARFVKNIKLLALGILLVSLCQTAQAKCTGKFVNPITDVCWKCIFPISIGGVKLLNNGNSDTSNPSSPICSCPNPFPRIGVSVGFWEPIRLVDVTKNPFCFPNLGGVEFSPGIKLGVGASPRSTGHGVGSWHVHWYIYPLLYWLELIMDFACMEQSAFDLAYITELDPLWQDDSLTFILNPEAALFANPVAQAACAADCIASSAGKPMDSLFWCGGCQGSMYPLNGKVGTHIGSVQSGLLAVERFTYKLHRQLTEWGTSGKAALCGKYIMPVIKKSQYRAQLTVPVPSDCHPYGKTTTFYESGKEIPIVGEDFGYLVWRKRNCCAF